MKNGRKVPFRQIISVNTVLVKFSSLKRDRTITVNDAKGIRESLGVN